MKKLLFALLAIAVSPPLFAQESGTITSTQCVAIDVKVDKSTVGIQVTGTWSGTLQPQVSIQGQPAANTQVVPSTSTTPQATITGNGVFYANVGGGGIFQVCGNTVGSGTANIFLNGSKGVNASLLGGGGSGSGTVSANNGSAGAIAGYTSAGGSTTVTPFGMTYSAPTLTISAAGAGNGTLALSGNTSGTATLTPSATAATLTSNVPLLGPNGTLCTVPTYSFTNAATSGFLFNSGSGVQSICVASNETFRFAGSLFEVSAANFGIIWNNNTNFAGSFDAGIFRMGAGVVELSNSSSANSSGILLSANTCRITADVSLTVNTANSFCSWSLPAVAQAWAFRCDIQWAITAGSGTNTLALGVNPSQTPTGTTNAEAQIYTATTGTQTMGSTAISASGADVILTGATYTPAATVQLAKISGTLLASGTAGTFAIQATANGTTATAAVKAGSACWLN